MKTPVADTAYFIQSNTRACVVPTGSEESDLDGNKIPAGHYALVEMTFLEPVQAKAD